MKTQTVKRSSIYQKQFDDQQMLDAFGTLTPSTEKRTAHFFSLWIDWRKHRVKLKRNSVRPVRSLLNEIGFKELWEYQLREGEVRFCNPDILAMAVLYGIDEYKEVRYNV